MRSRDSRSEIFNRLRGIAPYGILLLLIILFLVQAYLFIKADTLIQHSDHHSFISGKYHSFFSGVEGTIFPRDWYPPVLYFVTHLFYSVRGGSVETARMSLLFFVPVFLLSMFGIGRKYGGPLAGVVTASLAASSPFILNTSISYFPDFPQTAMTALCFCILLYTDEYRNTFISYLLGICLALSFLTKWSTPFFITIPLLWFILPHIFRSWKSAITFFINFLYLGLIIYMLLIYKEISGPGIDPLLWLYYYIKNIAIPIILYILVLYTAEWVVRRRRLKQKEITKDNISLCNKDTSTEKPESADDEKSISGSKTREQNCEPQRDGWINTLNFSRMSSVAMLLISPWLVYSALDIREKFIFEHQLRDRSMGLNEFTFNYMLLMFKNHFNLSLILLCLGIIFLFIRREMLFENLILPVNIITCIGLMSYIGSTDSRYFLSLIIFTAVLSGYWIQYIKKYQVQIAGILISVSLLSIVSWIWFPQSPVFQRISRDRMSVIHTSEVNSSVFSPRILSGDIPYSLSGVDLSFIPLEMIKYKKRYLKIKTFDMVNVPGIRYPSPSLKDMLIDVALKHNVMPGPADEMPLPISQFDKFIILFNRDYDTESIMKEIEQNHRGERFTEVTKLTEQGFFIKFIMFYEKEEKYP